MAKKQSRRSVSLNRSIYEAAKEEADRRGLSLAALVESSLGAAGVPLVEHAQQPLSQVKAHPRRVVEAASKDDPKVVPSRLPSRERQLLGDGVADAMGFA